MSPALLRNRSDLAYSESLEDGLIAQSGESQLAVDAPAGYPNLYLQNATGPSTLEPVLTKALFEAHPPHREGAALVLEYGGHSADFSSQYFATNDALTGPATYAPEPPDPGPTGRDLYEWRGDSLALVNVLPGNASIATGASFASVSPDTDAVSADGRRVYWQASGHLYMREDGRTTREVHHVGAFLTASPDGLTVLLSDGCLYSLTTTTCADLTQGHGGFLGLVGQSKSLSRIYFVDTAALPGKNQEEEEAEPGKPNLYLYEAGTEARFIATLSVFDGVGGTENLDDWATAPGTRTAEASPDGRYLAFGSTESLTKYANVGPCEHNADGTAFVNVPCKEVFLYDSADGRLTCPSCSPTGEAPLGNSTLRRIYEAGGNSWLPQPRYLTDQGRFFFDSSDRLSSRDTNGRVEDVYELEPQGLGSCSRAAGCVSLISPGTGSVDSNFLAMDERADNVFFTSRERLVPADVDGLIDVYDARAEGGFSNENEAVPPECQGESCQPAPVPPPMPSSSTSGVQSSGNAPSEKPRRCAKGKSRRHGKCVRNKHRRTHPHKAKAKKKRARPDGDGHGGVK
jgi:hypothetical protein